MKNGRKGHIMSILKQKVVGPYTYTLQGNRKDGYFILENNKSIDWFGGKDMDLAIMSFEEVVEEAMMECGLSDTTIIDAVTVERAISRINNDIVSFEDAMEEAIFEEDSLMAEQLSEKIEFCHNRLEEFLALQAKGREYDRLVALEDRI